MQLKRLILGPLIWAKYGSTRPDVITLPGSSHRVHLNPDDDRAYKKLVMDSTRGRLSTPMRFWRDHVRSTAPSLCLDVGSNYGECLAFGDYPDSLCIAVEANPVLLPFLQRTRSDHPDADKIVIESCLVGDTDGTQAALYYSPKWTGGGSAIEGGSHLSVATVTSRTLDSLVAEHPEWQDSPVVMKMDIEGYEGRALTGFTDLFRRKQVVGIMEFDTEMLRKAGTDPEALFNQLAAHFSVFLTFPKKSCLRPVTQWTTLTQGGTLHCDLAFCSDTNLLQWEICPDR